VISRHEHESIIIGDDILITVVAIGRGVVRIGIEADKSISVDRLEIRSRKDRERDGRGRDPRPPRRDDRED
jgi:carbon storage regulator CsrA